MKNCKKILVLFTLLGIITTLYITQIPTSYADSVVSGGSFSNISMGGATCNTPDGGMIINIKYNGNNQTYIKKINADGTSGFSTMWQPPNYNSYSSNPRNIESIVVKPDGTIIAAGYSDNNSYPSQNAYGEYVIYNSSGTEIGQGMWVYGSASPVSTHMYGLTARPDGTVVITGSNGKYQILNADNTLGTYGIWGSGWSDSSQEKIHAALKTDGTVAMACLRSYQILNTNNTLGASNTIPYAAMGMDSRPDNTIVISMRESLFSVKVRQIINADNTLGSVVTTGISSSLTTVRPDGSIFVMGSSGQYQIINPDNTVGAINTYSLGGYVLAAVNTYSNGTVFIGASSISEYVSAWYKYVPTSTNFTINYLASSTTSIDLNVAWNGVNARQTVQYSPDNVNWYDSSSFYYMTSVTGLSNPNKLYYIRLKPFNYFTYPAPVSTYTWANVPTSVTTSATQTSVTVSWGANGNGSGTVYELYCNTTSNNLYTGTATSFTHTGLTAGNTYSYKVRAKNQNGVYTAYTSNVTRITVPANMTAPTVTSSGRMMWENSGRGRGYVTLSWSSVTGATGYSVWVFDGYDYRKFDVGNVTTWDSRVAKIYPTDATLNSYGNNTQTGDLFNHVKGGLDLPDTPNLLYLKTSATTYDTYNCHWFVVTAYNVSGESSRVASTTPTLPNATDTTIPTISTLSINNGAANTGARRVTINISSSDPLVANYTTDTSDDASGIAKYQVSNDNFSSYQVITGNSFQWDLIAGDGSKTVYIRAIDNAGNVSIVKTDSIYLVNDVTPPTISVNISNNATMTYSRYVNVQVEANDDLTPVDQLQSRFSLDGSTWYSFNGTSWVSNWGIYKAVNNNFDLGATGGKKYIYIQVKDANGNISNTMGSIVYMTDSIKPQVATAFTSPTVNARTDGTLTNNENLNGKIISCDGIAVQVVQGESTSISLTGLTNVSEIQTSLDGIVWSPSEILPSGTTAFSKDITLSSEGKKNIYIKFKNSDGAESQVYTRKFLVDHTSPVIDVKTTSGATATSGTTISLYIKAQDNVSPMTKLKYNITVGGSSSYALLPSDGIVTATIGSTTGLKNITIKVVDEAGNIATYTINVWKL